MQLKDYELGFYVDLTELNQDKKRIGFFREIQALGYSVENNIYWRSRDFLVFNRYKGIGSCTLQETFNPKSFSYLKVIPYRKVSPEVAIYLLESHTLANTPVEEENPSQEDTAPVESNSTILSQTPEGQRILLLLSEVMDGSTLYDLEGKEINSQTVLASIIRPHEWCKLLTTNKTEALDKEIENLKNRIQDLETKKQQILNEG